MGLMLYFVLTEKLEEMKSYIDEQTYKEYAVNLKKYRFDLMGMDRNMTPILAGLECFKSYH